MESFVMWMWITAILMFLASVVFKILTIRLDKEIKHLDEQIEYHKAHYKRLKKFYDTE